MLSPNAISEAAVADAIKKQEGSCNRHIDFDSDSLNDNKNGTTATTITTNENVISDILVPNHDESNETNHHLKKKQRCDNGKDEGLGLDNTITNNNNNNGEEHPNLNEENTMSNEPTSTNTTTTTTNNNNDNHTVHGEKQRSRNNNKNNSKSIKEAMNTIHEIWNNKNKTMNDDTDNNHNDDDDHDDANNKKINQTKQILCQEFDNILQLGMEAFHKNDALNRELIQAKELNESYKHEIDRLKLSENDSRASLLNLLQAVEVSKSNTRDISRFAQTEARLRNELSSIRYERDVAKGTNAELKRKSTLLEEEVRMLKTRVGKLTQDKIKIERESRAALGLARSMDSHVASDVEFYRRKVADLNEHLQSKNKVITDLKDEIESYKRDMQRSLSQNRLTQIRRNGGGNGDTRKR